VCFSANDLYWPILYTFELFRIFRNAVNALGPVSNLVNITERHTHLKFTVSKSGYPACMVRRFIASER
jgi:hypothetical protein